MAAVAWIRPRLRPWHGWLSVGSIVPSGYEAYARVLHPAGMKGGGPVPWSRVATWSGRPLTATSYFADIATRADGERWTRIGSPPAAGRLPREVASALVGVLEDFSASRERCWFCVWYGWGDIPVDPACLVDIAPEITASGRRYGVYHGGVRDCPPAPAFWWPEARAWFVATEVDAESTYVAGSSAAIRALLGHRDLEVLPAQLDDPFDGTHPGQSSLG